MTTNYFPTGIAVPNIKSRMKQIYISILFLSIIQQASSQSWLPLGSDERTANSLAMTAAFTIFTQVSGDGVPYVTYIDDVGNGNNLGDFKTHAKRFINGQWQFAGDAISPLFPGSDFFPVALDDRTPYVAYNEAFNPEALRFKLSVKKLNSETLKWEVVGQQGLSDASAGGTALAAANGKIYIAYSDEAADNKVTVKCFDNANAVNGWKTVGVEGISNGFSFGINLAIDNGIPYIAYLDFSDNLAYVKKFNGASWQDVGTNKPAGDLQVVIRSLKFDSHHTPYIAFADLVTGAGVIRNLNTANAWVTTGNGPFATGIEEPLSMDILHDIPFIAFGKKQNGITQLNVKKFRAADNTWTDAGIQPVTASPVSISNALLTTDNANKLFLTFRNLNGGIYEKTFEAGTVLPVTLTAFTVSRDNGSNLLQWATSNEQRNQSFEIEHSTDAVHFGKIGTVTAGISPGNAQHYNFIDAVPASGMNYYRLKLVDNAGNFSYSTIISISVNREQLPFLTLSPNPATDVLHAANLPAGAKTIVIKNAAGKTVKQLKQNNASVDVDIKELANGIYFFSVYNDQTKITRLFIK